MSHQCSTATGAFSVRATSDNRLGWEYWNHPGLGLLRRSVNIALGHNAVKRIPFPVKSTCTRIGE
jgi:hypothetical protein